MEKKARKAVLYWRKSAVISAMTAAAAFCPLASHTAFAAGPGSHFVGVTGGLAFPSTSSNIFTFGIISCFKLLDNIGLGAFYQHYGIDASFGSSVGTANVKSSTTYYGFEPQLVFAGSLDGFILGLRLGMTKSDKQASSNNSSGATIDITDSSTQFFVAPKLAYDYPIGRFTVGAEVSYALGFGGDAPSATLYQLSGKFWF